MTRPRPGRLAAYLEDKVLDAQMESVSGHPETLLFEPELVVRGSTGPAPDQPVPADTDPLQQEFSAG